MLALIETDNIVMLDGDIRVCQFLFSDCFDIDVHQFVQGVAKKLAPSLYALTLSNINRFLELFNCQNLEKICNNNINIDPIKPLECCYTTL